MLMFTTNWIRDSKLAGTTDREIKRWIDNISRKAPSVVAFDIAMSCIMHGCLHAPKLLGATTVQRKYGPLTDPEEGTAHPRKIEYVQFDLEPMVDAAAFASRMHAEDVSHMILGEYEDEYQDVVLSVEQIEKLVSKGKLTEDFVLDWVFRISAKEERSGEFAELHDAAIKTALEESQAFRDFISKAFLRYEIGESVEERKVKQTIEAWFAAN